MAYFVAFSGPQFSSLNNLKSTTLVSVFWTSKEAKRTFLVPCGVRMIPCIFYHLLGQKWGRIPQFSSLNDLKSITLVRVFWTSSKEAKRTFLIPCGVKMIHDIFYHLLEQKWGRIPQFSSLNDLKSITLVRVFWTSSKEAKRTFLIPCGVRMIPGIFYHLFEQKWGCIPKFSSLNGSKSTTLVSVSRTSSWSLRGSSWISGWFLDGGSCWKWLI